jgi:hypothetical protein|tara:strand:+ start:2212 stop:2775 length:564 start_codon:yes stop_codon:yes gene_type:complete
MYAIVKADQVIKILNGGQAYVTEDGTQHPSNIFKLWETSKLNEIGIYPIEEQNLSLDSKTEIRTNTIEYKINSNTVTSIKSKKDRDFNEVKINELKDINQIQNNLLSPTDWYYIRKIDKSTAIPSDVQKYRDDIRTAGDSMIKAITDASDKEAFQKLYPVWAVTDEDDQINTGGILGIWPDLKDYNL